ncbi:DUF2982 domain-containing protein [Parashewanella spongiae]|uniref:DUF2982 domain-containing protein n=1 Tax=Parashewanella spongiae TaxID=342950 RepID=A0A3A6UG26_9GAMM|nr:DUF2982 domain-containing protein [Parashewanella spongiae]MCL1078194.1 DUF2982 domain-containing protein [Parashewanella spongiae]RJY16389.1 DUF2982 domain-containing protein [Parashewanella spongiae]
MIKEFHICPRKKYDGSTFTFCGFLGLIISFTLFISSSYFAPGLVFFTLGAVSLILGAAQLLEPSISFTLSTNGFTYFHRRGLVDIDWKNIQRIDVLRVANGLEMIELPYIGVKLKRINPILDSISPRLATGLLTEQRSLMITASAQTEDEHALEAYLNHEFLPLTVNDERYRGVLAMFGRRSLMLERFLGYHLYIPADSFDRDINDFLKLLRETKENHDKGNVTY